MLWENYGMVATQAEKKYKKKVKTRKSQQHKTTIYCYWPAFLNVYKTCKRIICFQNGMRFIGN